VDLAILLAPFFAIIRSPLSTGPITSTALSSLHGIFVCGLIHPSSPNLEQALLDLSSTVSHCKFEASDSSGDEVVLLKILTLIQDCLCGSVGKTLGDIEVCEMLETVLTTCCQMRLSGKQSVDEKRLADLCWTEILRRTAENTMQLLVRTVFSKLCTLDPATEEAKLATKNDEDVQEPELKMNVQSQGIPKAEQESSEEKDNVENKNEGMEADQNSRIIGPHVQRMECTFYAFFIASRNFRLLYNRWLTLYSGAPPRSHQCTGS
jgi:brefeldin A-resistance guanine nucleotide exchange factor 1